MNCPLDGSPLVMTERQGIEIDYCPQCRGVWLDRGELDKIIERSAALETPVEMRREQPRDERGSFERELERTSPPRYEDDRRYEEPRRSGTGDIAGVIGDVLGKARDSRHHSSDYHHHKKKKKGGFLGEIFDFD